MHICCKSVRMPVSVLWVRPSGTLNPHPTRSASLNTGGRFLLGTAPLLFKEAYFCLTPPQVSRKRWMIWAHPCVVMTSVSTSPSNCAASAGDSFHGWLATMHFCPLPPLVVPNTHVHTQNRAHPSHARMHARTHTHSHAHTHTCPPPYKLEPTTVHT